MTKKYSKDDQAQRRGYVANFGKLTDDYDEGWGQDTVVSATVEEAVELLLDDTFADEFPDGHPYLEHPPMLRVWLMVQDKVPQFGESFVEHLVERVQQEEAPDAQQYDSWFDPTDRAKEELARTLDNAISAWMDEHGLSCNAFGCADGHNPIVLVPTMWVEPDGERAHLEIVPGWEKVVFAINQHLT